MLEKNKTAILFTANTPHVAHANLMLDSLLDTQKGNFKGDIWVISTGLSNRAKNYLDSRGVKFLISNLSSIYKWKNWKQVAKTQPEYFEIRKEKKESEILVTAFEAYRNKRMSKLILLDWVNKFGENYDFIALGDNDLYFQKDVNKLFENVYKTGAEKINYWQEENEITAGSNLWKKDFHYSRYHDASNLDFGNHEINIGFILGKPQNLFQVFEDVKKGFFELNIELFTKYSWHDQDLVRLNRAFYPERYRLLQEGILVHMCAGGDAVIEEKYSKEFFHKKTNNMPYLIHFAGGTWKKYASIKNTYTVNPDSYFFSWEVAQEHDLIRETSRINLFDDVNSEYFTKEIKDKKIETRKKWLKLNENGKKKLLFIGWLRTGTHKSTIEAIPQLFENSEYDIAILNGNTTGDNYYDNICEDFPKIIAEMTRIVHNPLLIRLFGFKIPEVPEWIFEDTIKSAIAEYGCTKRSAYALANLCYLYFAEALDFYKVDLVLLWGFLSPWGKMIQNLCTWKGIPICSLEWGILPGTVSFDFCGHMADSWVAKYSDFFNTLPITKKEIEGAKNYLEIAGCSEVSRNYPQKIDQNVCEKLTYLKNKGKKLILYMESNSAHSGNTFADSNRAVYHSPFYEDDMTAYLDVLEVCKQHKDWYIVYKPHPISITRGIQTKIDTNYTTVIYEGGLNEVLEFADLSITILSQSAYVSLIKNVPVLLLGNMQLNGSESAYILHGKGQLENQISLALKIGMDIRQRKKFNEHVARAIKYYVYSANKNIAIRDTSILVADIFKIMENKQPKYYQYEYNAYIKQLRKDSFVNENPTVSILMPVYNAEEFLSECINSICNQTLKSFELLCINNGSTDKSQMILEYHARKDSRIKLQYLEEPNQRAARNWGIDHAKGKYIYLMDSDDYLDINTLQTLVETAEDKNIDLLYFFFREVRTELNAVRPRPRYFSYRNFLPQEKLFKLDDIYYKFFIQYPFPWAKLMRRDFMLENELYFDNDCSNFDDNPHNLKTLLQAKNPYVYNEAFYNFRIHDKSMTQSKNSRIAAMIDAVRIMNKIYEEKNVYEIYQKWYVPYKIHLLGWAWDFLPEELKEDYYGKVKELFRESDLIWFNDDEVWSHFEMPASVYLNRVKMMLDEVYKEVKEKEPSYVENEIKLNKKPWEEISRLHLYAIIICEKLHIIKLVIKIKKRLIRNN